MEETFKGYTDFVDDIEENSFDNFLKSKRTKLRKAIKHYMEEGYSKKDALALAKKDAKQSVQSWIEGALHLGKKKPKGWRGKHIGKKKPKGWIGKHIGKKKPEGWGLAELSSPEGARNVGDKAKRKARLKNLMQELIRKAKAETIGEENKAKRKAKIKARFKNLMQELIKKAKAEGTELSQEEVQEIKNVQIEEEIVLEDDIVLRDKGVAPITATSLSGANADSFFQKNKKALMIAGAVAVAGIVYFKFIKK